VSAVTTSQTLAMYSMDSEPLVAQIVENYHSVEGGMPTLITQDQSCYRTNEGTRVAAPFLALRGSPNFRWAVGTSDKDSNISHMKAFVGDDSFTISGSTNWSGMGMNEEDNECEVTLNTVLAAQLTARIEAIYAWQIANCQQP
jgi:phosphatidylserine/phosphatidylglycerophosphate/cardiolipin synthase-like enzyme